MVLRIVLSDHGSHGSMPFSYRAVLEAKKTAKLKDSRFFRLDCTVRSGFQNLGQNQVSCIKQLDYLDVQAIKSMKKKIQL